MPNNEYLLGKINKCSIKLSYNLKGCPLLPGSQSLPLYNGNTCIRPLLWTCQGVNVRSWREDGCESVHRGEDDGSFA